MSNKLHRWCQRWLNTADELGSRARKLFESNTSSDSSLSPLELSSLEPRILYSATPIDPALVAGNEPLVVEVQQNQEEVSQTEAIQTAQVSTGTLIIIDSSVPDLEQLLDDLRESGRDSQTIVLDAERDGVDQITEILDSRSEVGSIHLVSHGEGGAIKLGNTWLGPTNLAGYAGQLAKWESSLTESADLLIYGCDLADSAEGRTFVDSISELTGADVSASDDDTGHSRYGADWDLEYSTGQIESVVAFSETLQNTWESKLATITVTTFADEVSSNGATSLREAILANNAGGGGDTIDLSTIGAGTFSLTDSGAGNLEITQDVTIIGVSARTSIIDASALGERAFLLSDSSIVTISHVTIQGGSQNNGGAIYADNSSVLNLSDSILTNNSSDKGGAIHVHGTANLNRVLLFNNSSSDEGGAIHFHNGGGSLTNVTISGNTAGSDGGGVMVDSGNTVDIINSTITLNEATGGGAAGGGIKNNGTVNLTNTIVAGNTASTQFEDVSGTFTSDGSNLIQVSIGGSGLGSDITGVDPNLGTLADNGGPTDTHAITNSSAAYNAGVATGAPTIDGRGFTSGDGLIDIGAFQVDALLYDAIYWADVTNSKIYRADLDGNNAVEFLNSADGLGPATEVVIDNVNERIYWSEYSSGKIRRANLDGSGGIEDLYTGLTATVGIALDVANNMIYWTENPLIGGTNKIQRADMDGGGSIEDLGIAGSGPSHLELDLAAGKLYWTDDDAGELNRANLDGSGSETVVSGLGTPRGLKLDLANRMAYWTVDRFSSTDKIQRVNLDGSPVVEDLLASGLQGPGGIDIDFANNMVYWAEQGSDKIFRAELANPLVPIEIFTGGLALPYGVALGADLWLAPTAVSGDYEIVEGESLVLDGGASTDNGSITNYEWDLNNDGDFSDLSTSSATATVTWADLSTVWGIDDGDVGGTDYTIQLRVTENNGLTNSTTATVTVTDTAPTLTTTGSGTAVEGSTYTLNLSSTDPGSDTIAGWIINWGDGTISNVGDVSSATHSYTGGTGLTYNILAAMVNEDGTFHQAGSFLTSSASNPDDAVYRIDSTTGNYSVTSGSVFGGTILSSPVEAIFGTDGNLYVGSFGSNRVELFDIAGNHLGNFITDAELSQVSGLEFGPDGNLYIASHGTNEIHRYDSSGNRVDSVGTPFVSGLSGPLDLLFHNDGFLYVSNYNNGSIQRFDATTGALINDPGGAFVNAGTLSGPEFMAFGTDGYLYVASYDNDSIYRFDSNGNNVEGASAYISGAGLDGPIGMAFGPDGLLYVGTENSDVVRRYNVDGAIAVHVDDFVDDPAITNNRVLVFQPSHQVTVTPSSINVLSRETVDNDSDGQIDYLRLTTSADLNDDFSGLSISVAGYALDATTPFVTNIGAGGANDNVFFVKLQQNGTPDTGSTPLVTITGNSTLGRTTGSIHIAADSTGVTATDNAGAVLIAALSPHVNGTNLFQTDGDELHLVFSESLSALPSEAQLESALQFANGAFDGDNLPSIDGGVSPFSLTTSTYSNDTIRIVRNLNNVANANQMTVGVHSAQVVDGSDLTDNAGNTANLASLATIIGTANVEPTLTATPTNPTFTEDNPPASLFINANADTIEPTQTFTNLTLTITNINDGSNERLGADGSVITLTNGQTGTTTTNGLTYTVALSGSTATIEFSGGSLVATELESLVESLTYQNTSNTPSTSDRVATITLIRDSGGTIGGGDDTATLSLVSTVTVNQQNDAPTLAGGPVALPGTNEDATSTGTQVSNLLSALTAGDLDGDTLGFAISAASGAGTWQFSVDSTDGTDGNWTAFGTVAADNALLLSNSSWIRYEPTNANSETATLTFHAWDGATGSASLAGTPSKADPGGGGGSTAFSNSTAQASLAVTDVTHVPTVANALPDRIATQDVSFNFQFAANTFVDLDGDTLTYTAIQADSSPLPTWLQFDSATRTFSGTPEAPDVGTLTIRVIASDGVSGSASDDFILQVNNLADLPVGINDTYVTNEDTSLNSNDEWLDSSWSFRRTLTFDNADRSENLSGFPVLIQLDSTRIDYSQTLNDGSDLRFVDGNGNLLAHEIELWDEAGTSYVWVRVPQVDQNSATDFVWMYYGNASATDAQNAAAVWSGHDTVQHLHADAADSSSNNNDGTDVGTTNAAGFIADAQTFGSGDIINLGDDASLQNVFQSGGTVSAWFNASGWGGNNVGRILDKSSGVVPSPAGWNLSLNQNSDSLFFEYGFENGIGRWQAQANAITLNQWHHVAVVFNSDSATNTPIFYIDGNQVSATEEVTPLGNTLTDASIDLAIGNHVNGMNRHFEGEIDEVRIVDGAKSADWVRAQFQTETDGLITYGYVQTTAGVLGNDFDADGDVITASLVGGDPNNAQSFNLNADGSFTYTPNTNFTGADTFTYVANDGSGDSNLVTVTINVTAQNDAPTDITLSNDSVSENADGAAVGNVGVVDPDAGDTHSWDVDDNRFEIVGNQLKLKTGETLNKELESTISLQITVQDQGGAGIPFDKTFTITVDNVNEAPTDITLSNAIVVENSPGAVIGNVGVADPDAGDTHTWSVDDARFEIVGTQLKLRNTQSLNHEAATTITIEITATDQGGSGIAYQESFDITVGNANEAPTDISLDSLNVSENADGAVIGNVAATDPDPGDTHAWSVDDTRFEFVGSQLKLKTGESLDRETEPTVSLVITAVDQAGSGLAFDKTFTITVDNVNEAPVADPESYQVSAGSTLTVSSPGILEGDYDPEGDLFSAVLLTGPSNGILSLNPDGSFSYTANTTFTGVDTFTYEAWDGTASSSETTVTIRVSPVFRVPIPPTPEPKPDPEPEPEPDPDEPTEDDGDDEDDGRGPSGGLPGGKDEPSTPADPKPPAIDPGITTITTKTETGSEQPAILNDGSPGDPNDDSDRDQRTNNRTGNNQTPLSFSRDLTHEAGSLADHVLMTQPGMMWNELDQQLNHVDSQIQGDLIVVGAAGAAASSFTIYAVAWALRTGFLASGLLAQLPAWTAIDPLTIMKNMGDSEEGESLEDMMKRQSQALDE